MIRTLFLLLAWFVAVPAFSQGKPTSPSTQEQLLELRLEQQHLKEKLDDQKASLEEKFEVKKENLEYQREETNGWITLFGLVVTVIGIGLPVINFFIGKRIVEDVEKQKEGMVLEQEELKSQITKKQEEVDKKHQEQLVWMETLRLDAEKTFNIYREELHDILKEAKVAIGEINHCKEESIDKTNDISEYHLRVMPNEQPLVREPLNLTIEESLKNEGVVQKKDITSFEDSMINALMLFNIEDSEMCIKQYLHILENYEFQISTEEKVEVYYRIAYSYWIIGNNENAVKYFEKVLDLDPSDEEVCSLLGFIHEEINQHEKAIEYFSKASNLIPNNTAAYYNLATAYLSLKDFMNAIYYYGKSVAINPYRDNAWQGMGVAFYIDHKYERALECFQKAVEICPYNETAWYNLGLCYWQIKRIDETVMCLNEVVRYNENSYVAWRLLGIVYSKIGKYELAIDCFENVLKIDPNDRGVIADLIELLIIANNIGDTKVLKLLSKYKICMGYNEFVYQFLDLINKVKNKIYKGNVVDAVFQLQQTVNDDASKIKWNFIMLNDWLAREKVNPTVLDEGAREFITDLIRQIEEWRGSQPKAE